MRFLQLARLSEKVLRNLGVTENFDNRLFSSETLVTAGTASLA